MLKWRLEPQTHEASQSNYEVIGGVFSRGFIHRRVTSGEMQREASDRPFLHGRRGNVRKRTSMHAPHLALSVAPAVRTDLDEWRKEDAGARRARRPPPTA